MGSATELRYDSDVHASRVSSIMTLGVVPNPSRPPARRLPPGLAPSTGVSGPGLLHVRVRTTAFGWAPSEVEIIPQRLSWSLGR